MNFGLIARADRGGIAAQTWEVARHLHPRRVLIVDLGARGRGPTDPSLYDGLGAEVRVTEHGFPTKRDARWLLQDRPSSVFSVEGLYGEEMRVALAHKGTKTIVQCNPELYVPADLAGVNLTVVLPTRWEAARFDDPVILPVPVNTRDLVPVHREIPFGDARLLHMAGAAMADRNGTRQVIAACRMVKVRGSMLVANRDDTKGRKLGRLGWRPIEDEPTYLGHWAPERRPDLLVLPRRYGGLSLPMQEAAACGVPIVTSDLPPQNEWVHAAGLVPVSGAPAQVHMKGGVFPVYSVAPAELARRIDVLMLDPGVRCEASLLAREWAEEHSWERLGDEYRELLA